MCIDNKDHLADARDEYYGIGLDDWEIDMLEQAQAAALEEYNNDMYDYENDLPF